MEVIIYTMSKPKVYDFSGWATRFGVKCSDGRTIMQNAFNDNDGMTVPLIYNHDHNSIGAIVGHMYLEHRDKGIYGYGTFNETESGKCAKELVRSGDVTALSIFANKLTQDSKRNVIHGMIREVSLVLAGANPEAFIDNVIAHSEDGSIVDSDEAYITYGEDGELDLYHGEENQNDQLKSDESKKESDIMTDINNELEHSESDFTPEFIKSVEGKTVAEIIDGMKISKDEKNFIYNAIAAATQSGEESNTENKEDNTVKHNIFDSEEKENKDFILHKEDEEEIIAYAKNTACGSLKNAIETFKAAHADELAHAASTPFDNPDTLFPEYKDVSAGNPEVLRNNTAYVDVILNGVHSSPASFIKTKQVDERLAELRANGYIKGDEKSKMAARKVLSRKTSPQAIYVNNEIDRDEFVDIEDFDAVAYLKSEDTRHLKEEIARAILIGDGREESDVHKINEENVRSIYNDDDLYSIKATIDTDATLKKLQGTDTSKYFGTDFINARAVIDAIYNARINFKGTGKPVMFCSEECYSWFMLATDRTGHDAFDTVEKIKTKLMVSDIVTVDKFAGIKKTHSDSKDYNLVAILVNPDDYIVGANKNGKLTSFNDFDIDFNKMKTLTETRMCGALRSPLTAIVVEAPVATAATSD